MQALFHPLSELFAQLGLGSSAEEIDIFQSRHSPLPAEVILSDADFWSPAQAAFLSEAQEADSDWAEVVDKLNVALRVSDADSP